MCGDASTSAAADQIIEVLELLSPHMGTHRKLHVVSLTEE
jgi:hypothetical protein